MASPLPPMRRVRVAGLSLLVWAYAMVAVVAAAGAVFLAVHALTPPTRDTWWQLLAASGFLYVAGMWGRMAVDHARHEIADRLEAAGDGEAGLAAAAVREGPPGSVGSIRHPVMWRTLIGHLALLAATGVLIWDTPGWGSLASEDGEPLDRTMWSLLLLTPGVVLAWAWTWRLGRYLLGTLWIARPVQVEVLVAHLKWDSAPQGELPLPVGAGEGGAGWPAACWLRVSEPGGRARYQRAMWTRRLVVAAAGGRPVAARARRCPGFRRMLLVDVPVLGRFWPTSTARPRPPANYHLRRYDPARMGTKHYWTKGGPSGVVSAVVALGVTMIMVWFLAGPAGAGYVPVLVAGYWLWQGGAPFGGIYSYLLRPAPDR